MQELNVQLASSLTLPNWEVLFALFRDKKLLNRIQHWTVINRMKFKKLKYWILHLEWSNTRHEYKLGDFTVDASAFMLIIFSLFSFCYGLGGKRVKWMSWGAWQEPGQTHSIGFGQSTEAGWNSGSDILRPWASSVTMCTVHTKREVFPCCWEIHFVYTRQGSRDLVWFNRENDGSG